MVPGALVHHVFQATRQIRPDHFYRDHQVVHGDPAVPLARVFLLDLFRRQGQDHQEFHRGQAYQEYHVVRLFP